MQSSPLDYWAKAWADDRDAWTTKTVNPSGDVAPRITRSQRRFSQAPNQTRRSITSERRQGQSQANSRAPLRPNYRYDLVSAPKTSRSLIVNFLGS